MVHPNLAISHDVFLCALCVYGVNYTVYFSCRASVERVSEYDRMGADCGSWIDPLSKKKRERQRELMKEPLQRAASLALMATLLILVNGCAYMHTQMPLSVEYHKTELGAKVGRASSYSVLWLVSWGDSGTKAAAEQGNIKIIDCADREVKVVLFGLYTRATTVIYGD